MIWRRRCRSVSIGEILSERSESKGGDFFRGRVLMNEYLPFDSAQGRRPTMAGEVLSARSESKGTLYICSRFDTVALGGQEEWM